MPDLRIGETFGHEFIGVEPAVVSEGVAVERADRARRRSRLAGAAHEDSRFERTSEPHADVRRVCAAEGLSGMLRDYAYEYGEATNRHWMTLVLADRIDMIEGMITSALRGRPDNYVREKGWTAYAKYEPARGRKLLAIGAGIVGALAVGLAVQHMLSED